MNEFATLNAQLQQPPADLHLAADWLTARKVVKNYRLGRRPVEVLREIDLTVEKGGFLAIRGASGAGKSTLLHLLGGLDLPDAGEIWIGGQNVSKLSPGQMARYRNCQVGFVFQAYHLLPELDALENVCLPAQLAQTPAPVATARAKDLLARVGLTGRWQHRPYELSGGEQQRLAIARSLINKPALILADEPTGNLDSHTGEEIINLLCALHAEHQTTLIVATHDAKVAARAHRRVELVDGKIRGYEAD